MDKYVDPRSLLYGPRPLSSRLRKQSSRTSLQARPFASFDPGADLLFSGSRQGMKVAQIKGNIVQVKREYSDPETFKRHDTFSYTREERGRAFVQGGDGVPYFVSSEGDNWAHLGCGMDDGKIQPLLTRFSYQEGQVLPTIFPTSSGCGALFVRHPITQIGETAHRMIYMHWPRDREKNEIDIELDSVDSSESFSTGSISTDSDDGSSRWAAWAVQCPAEKDWQIRLVDISEGPDLPRSVREVIRLPYEPRGMKVLLRRSRPCFLWRDNQDRLIFCDENGRRQPVASGSSIHFPWCVLPGGEIVIAGLRNKWHGHKRRLCLQLTSIPYPGGGPDPAPPEVHTEILESGGLALGVPWVATGHDGQAHICWAEEGGRENRVFRVRRGAGILDDPELVVGHPPDVSGISQPVRAAGCLLLPVRCRTGEGQEIWSVRLD